MDYPTGVFQHAAFRIHPEFRQGVACLIGAVKKPAIGRQRGKTGAFTPARNPADGVYSAVQRRYGKHADTVVPTIRCIQEPTVGMNDDLTGIAAARMVRRQAGEGLHQNRFPRRAIIGKHADGIADFIDNIQEASIRMEVRMPGPAAGRHIDFIGENALAGAEGINPQHINTVAGAPALDGQGKMRTAAIKYDFMGAG